MTTVAQDLVSALGVEANSGEAPAEFAKRLALKANAATDDAWPSLPEPAQIWVNDALDALEKKQDVPLPEGIEALLGGETTGDTAKTPTKKAPKGKSKAKAKSEPKVKTKGKTKAAVVNGGRGPKGGFATTDKIKLLKPENPFREGSKCHNWWALYTDGMTVEAAIAAGVPRHHIRWDRTLGYIRIGK